MVTPDTPEHRHLQVFGSRTRLYLSIPQFPHTVTRPAPRCRRRRLRHIVALQCSNTWPESGMPQQDTSSISTDSLPVLPDTPDPKGSALWNYEQHLYQHGTTSTELPTNVEAKSISSYPQSHEMDHCMIMFVMASLSLGLVAVLFALADLYHVKIESPYKPQSDQDSSNRLDEDTDTRFCVDMDTDCPTNAGLQQKDLQRKESTAFRCDGLAIKITEGIKSRSTVRTPETMG